MIIGDSRPAMKCDFHTVQAAVDSLPEREYLGVVIAVHGKHFLEKPIELGDRYGIEIRGGEFILQGEEEDRLTPSPQT